MVRRACSIVVVALVACIVAAPLTALPARAITGGEPDGDAHPFVGLVFDADAFCTGTLIAPTIVLTAGHCTSSFQTDGSTVFVTFDPAPTTASVFYTGTPYTDPDYVPIDPPAAASSAANDIGVVVLDKPVTVTSYGSVPTAAIPDLAVRALSQLTAVGYGVHSFSPLDSQQPTALGTRTVADLALAAAPGAAGPGVLALEAARGVGGGEVCFGDSGGPIFQGQTATILAVVSAGTDTRCQGPSLAARVDTPSALAFLAPFLNQTPVVASSDKITIGSTVVVTDNGVRLRSGPSTDSDIITELEQGHVLTVVGPSAEGSGYVWWPVRDPADPSLSGYIAANYVVPQR